MNPIAIYSGTTLIYWAGIVIALAVAAWFCLSYSLYTANGGKGAAMWVFLPIATVLSVILSRFIHWYSHTEQYISLISALTDYSSGGYCMPGVLIAVFFTALLVHKLSFAPSYTEFTDALVPGMALGIAIIRLSSLFNNSGRSKIAIENPAFQKLPIGSGITNAAGVVEYRFATFFIQFLLFLILAAVLVFFYCRRRKVPMKNGYNGGGHVTLMFLVMYGALELILDSTRYDSSFFRWNGFVSMVQIFSAMFVIGIFIFYSVYSVKFNGLKIYHIIMWVFFLCVAGATGYLEYLVQRHGDWYRMCYGFMGMNCAILAASNYVMYRTVCQKPE